MSAEPDIFQNFTERIEFLLYRIFVLIYVTQPIESLFFLFTEEEKNTSNVSVSDKLTSRAFLSARSLVVVMGTNDPLIDTDILLIFRLQLVDLIWLFVYF